MARTTPDTASIAHATQGAKLFAPSAARNAPDICNLLAQFAPTTGKALEIASGTGQHSVAFAQKLPDLHWQPTDIDTARRASIDAYTSDSGLRNIAPALPLDACSPGWGAHNIGQSLIVVVNLLHLISTPEAEILITEAARALAPAGRFVIYGPFMRGGDLTSKNDAEFHASLIGHDPDIGYKDDFDTLDMVEAAGLGIVEIVEMPANNLALIGEKPIS